MIAIIASAAMDMTLRFSLVQFRQDRRLLRMRTYRQGHISVVSMTKVVDPDGFGL